MEGLASKSFNCKCGSGLSDVVIAGITVFGQTESSYDLILKMEKYIKSENKEELHNNAYASSSKFDQKKIIWRLSD